MFKYNRGLKTCYKCSQSNTRLFFRNKCTDANCSNGHYKKDAGEQETCSELNFLRKLFENKDDGKKTMTISNIYANTNWIEVI